jgi:hypothetical protein
MPKKERTMRNVPVSKLLNAALEKAVLLDTHSTEADFIGDLLLQKGLFHKVYLVVTS